MKKQVFNPFLPPWEYSPDGEPHVFDGRLYLFGSHDSEGGERYCAEGNYVGWSAPVDDLSDWRYEGVIYEARQDPRVHGDFADLYAPDVVRGNDGRYYLYYCSSDSEADIEVKLNGKLLCSRKIPAGEFSFLLPPQEAMEDATLDVGPVRRTKWMPADPRRDAENSQARTRRVCQYRILSGQS